MIRSPLTMMTAVAGSARSPRRAIRPSTVTLPRAMSVSQARREPTPATARTFCRRSAPSVSAGLGIAGDLFHVVRQERGQRGKLGDRVQAEFLQEQGGRLVEVRAGLRLDTALLDEAPGNQRTHHAVTV